MHDTSFEINFLLISVVARREHFAHPFSTITLPKRSLWWGKPSPTHAALRHRGTPLPGLCHSPFGYLYIYSLCRYLYLCLSLYLLSTERSILNLHIVPHLPCSSLEHLSSSYSILSLISGPVSNLEYLSMISIAPCSSFCWQLHMAAALEVAADLMV